MNITTRINAVTCVCQLRSPFPKRFATAHSETMSSGSEPDACVPQDGRPRADGGCRGERRGHDRRAAVALRERAHPGGAIRRAGSAPSAVAEAGPTVPIVAIDAWPVEVRLP